jgi:nitroreductase
MPGLAQQAPTASYAQNWHFVVVTDPQRRAALGELWRSVAEPYVERRAAAAAAGASTQAKPQLEQASRPVPAATRRSERQPDQRAI